MQPWAGGVWNDVISLTGVPLERSHLLRFSLAKIDVGDILVSQEVCPDRIDRPLQGPVNPQQNSRPIPAHGVK